MLKDIRHGLSETQWARVEPWMAHAKYRIRRQAHLPTRDFLHAVCWVLKTGAPWRDLPREFGPWHLVYKRFARWSERGVLDTICKELTQDADREMAMRGGSYVQAHQDSVGKKAPNRRPLGPLEAVERPRFTAQSTRLEIPCTCI